MLKKILLSMVALFVITVVGVGGMLWAASSAAGADTKQFFEATRGASLAQIEAQLAPELKAKAVDPELFAAFVKEIATRFGALESIKSDEFSDNLNGSRRSRQIKGLFVFEKRELSMTVGFLGDQLSTLIVHDPVGVEIADAVTRVPTDTAIYVKGGQRYLEAMLGGRTDEAFDMLAEDKQKTMDRAEFMKWGREVPPTLGGVKGVEVLRVAARPNTKDRLDITYRVTCGSTVIDGEIEFQFRQLAGQLVGFGTSEK